MVILFAFLASYCSIFAIKPLAEYVGLVDTPCSRKKHVGSIPLIGGVSIFVAVLISSIVFLPLDKALVSFLFCSAAIVLLGVVDDYRQLSVKVRLFTQACIALLMMWGADAYIRNLGDLLGFGCIDMGYIGIPFTVIAIIAAINAFNMIDGIDGLAGAMSITTFTSILVLMGVKGGQLTMLPLIIIATILPYLAFNLGVIGHKNKKIFMGDAGSMFIGFSVIWLLMMSTQSHASNAFSPVTALWIIAIPLMDMMAIIVRRVKKGQSPFRADRDHLHHVFMRIGFSSRKALVTISLLAVSLALVGIIGELIGVPDWLMLVAFVAAFIAYSACIQHAWKVARFLRARVFTNKSRKKAIKVQ
ncbi:undecaprenyl-phosphate alpha-N-acetylglucosaminyl 1-phosphate transferase [Pseudoalteromonas sp. A25]|uniref:UDP-N-acetylglucosamine--undecaprenyl-phosphate N-acetylglucosaminephosphotransferase n=1 Tax=Pseudoalteromonas sp. A25 TaxID=116092 RepID=UPI001260EB87|nr:UDP-N-acetylglucosamine--undecaprenyl-phosphate N-acetylglucosaminephosphotransferase [Pseudoalteromonas sp. A25]BBN80370.1 undecaprenyl-phosphate alpha-N-acetylglucosaminyl 1-phosphate transferase [Pseudoalteromonas sp. A25]